MIINIEIIKSAKLVLKQALDNCEDIYSFNVSFNGRVYTTKIVVNTNPLMSTLRRILSLPDSINGYKVVYEIITG